MPECFQLHDACEFAAATQSQGITLHATAPQIPGFECGEVSDAQHISDVNVASTTQSHSFRAVVAAASYAEIALVSCVRQHKCELWNPFASYSTTAVSGGAQAVAWCCNSKAVSCGALMRATVSML